MAGNVPATIVGIDPTGTQKSSVPVTIPGGPNGLDAAIYCGPTDIIAGDGYLYSVYQYDTDFGLFHMTNHLHVLRVGTDGSWSDFTVRDWVSGFSEICVTDPALITNADQAILLTFRAGFEPFSNRNMAFVGWAKCQRRSCGGK